MSAIANRFRESDRVAAMSQDLEGAKQVFGMNSVQAQVANDSPHAPRV